MFRHPAVAGGETRIRLTATEREVTAGEVTVAAEDDAGQLAALHAQLAALAPAEQARLVQALQAVANAAHWSFGSSH